MYLLFSSLEEGLCKWTLLVSNRVVWLLMLLSCRSSLSVLYSYHYDLQLFSPIPWEILQKSTTTTSEAVTKAD